MISTIENEDPFVEHELLYLKRMNKFNNLEGCQLQVQVLCCPVFLEDGNKQGNETRPY